MPTRKTDEYKLTNNFGPMGSSALCLDIRNSTKLVRLYSELDQIKFHARFLTIIKNLIFKKNMNNKFCMNDTGDGLMCLFWDDNHAWTALKTGILLKSLIDRDKNTYDEFLFENNIMEKFDYGIGIHSGKSIIYKSLNNDKEYMYGSILNTTARLESFTKTYKDINFLFTDFFKTVLLRQMDANNKAFGAPQIRDRAELLSCLRQISEDKVEINDSHKSGHSLWTIKKEIYKIFNLQDGIDY